MASLPQFITGGSSPASKAYAPLGGSDVQLATETLSLSPSGTVTAGRLPRLIRANAAGDIKVVYASGVLDTLHFLAGESQAVDVQTLVSSGTTCPDFTVYW